VWWESGWVGNGVKGRGKGKGKVVVFLPPSPQNYEVQIFEYFIRYGKFTISVDYIMG
jgi:hypothetical protein